MTRFLVNVLHIHHEAAQSIRLLIAKPVFYDQMCNVLITRLTIMHSQYFFNAYLSFLIVKNESSLHRV